MESIHHFSHYHPLFLKKIGEICENKEFVCYGCQEQITEKDNYYACQVCSFYLHKKCADLPRQIYLPIHKHPLILFASSPYHSTCGCDMCQRSDWEWFTYHCSLCKFDIDVICSSLLLEGEKDNLQHEGHPHPLTLILRPSLFLCDACNTKDEELSYFCNTCQFWIHKSCASAPKSIEVVHHDDPLVLAYSLPEQHLNFKQFCNICKERVHQSNWVYYCDDCRYFNHIKCATSNPPRLTTGESEIQDEEGDTESSQLIQFPFSNRESVPDPLSLFVANKIASVAYDDGPTEISHRLHHHPISIFTTKNVEYNDMICDGCVRPISAPFYSCSKCNFFLHKFCAELPEELQCPLDSGHSIKVTKNKRFYDLFKCSFCLQPCNGFLCECVSCDLKLDIGCASNLIPSRIKHNSHGQHPLVRSYLPRREQNLRCNACNIEYTGGSLTYSCKACSFNLCIDCVNYPGSVRHEYDRHSIPLTYPPIKDHPSDFICEICEEDINPSYWMYHCKDCTQSFHTECLSPFDEYSNVKFGEIKHDSHGQHPLVRSHLPRHEQNLICNACNRVTGGSQMYSCKACSFNLCINCVNKPGSVWHEFDRHSIPLTYPPIKYHPSDFICEICKEDINPRDWMYHCKDCNQSFHTECLSPTDWYSNVKYGGKVNIDKIHTHPLTFVRNIKSENASFCGQCGEDWNGYPILECE